MSGGWNEYGLWRGDLNTKKRVFPSQLNLGLKLRDKGVARVTSHNTAWIEQARCLIEVSEPWTRWDADRIRERIGDPPTANAMGAVFRLSQPYLTFSHYEKATRASRHANRNAVWLRSPAPPSESPR